MNDDLYRGQGAESRIGRAVGEEPGRVGSGCLSNSGILSIMNHYLGRLTKMSGAGSNCIQFQQR